MDVIRMEAMAYRANVMMAAVDAKAVEYPTEELLRIITEQATELGEEAQDALYLCLRHLTDICARKAVKYWIKAREES